MSDAETTEIEWITMFSCAISHPPDIHEQCIEKRNEYVIGEGRIRKVLCCRCPCHQLDKVDGKFQE
jgi:hypothetical protein